MTNSCSLEFNYNKTDWLNGSYKGSSGGAVIVKNCVVENKSNGIIRPVEQGTLIQVWSFYNDVRFSVVSDDTGELDESCLICKAKDIAPIPKCLWGAFFPLTPLRRVEIAKDSSLLAQLELINIGNDVNILMNKKEIRAKIVWKDCLPNYSFGIYYGISYTEDNNELMTTNNSSSKIVTLDQIIPIGYSKSTFLQDMDNPTIGMPKSLSHNALRQRADSQVIRHTSRSLDSTTTHLKMGQGNTLNTDISYLRSKGYSTSRSFDSSQTTCKKLARSRASASLDSASNLCKAKAINISRTGALTLFEWTENIQYHNMVYSRDDRFLIPLPVLSGRWHSNDSETASEENFYDVPTSARHRKISEAQAKAKLAKTHTAKYKSLDQNAELDIGSLVEIAFPDEKLYGVIQWIGHLPDAPEEIYVGIEMEEELEEDLDTKGLFSCAPYKAYFAPLRFCRQDTRFSESSRKRISQSIPSFGLIDCPVVKGTLPPITDLKNICGKNRGIQGHHNSCYLDSTLFAMFAFTSVFDSLLYRPRTKLDIPEYEEVQGVLRDEIVNPLRSNLYVRADRVMKLRTQLEKLSSVSGLTSEEKDPEEFLNSLLAQILRAQPFLQLSSGQDAFHYQLFVEKDERLNVPTVQQLFEQSFVASDIKLKQLPPCLIVQMPRFGKSFKMYPCIIPPTELDVTDVIENSPRQCTVCGNLAEMECRECYLSGMEGCSFCRGCLDTVHKRPSRLRHVPRPLMVPTEFLELQEHCAVPRLVMKLFAVVCIETSHYVAFLNTNQGWVFFDSMADRKGEQNGYNIPEIVSCPDVAYWLSNEGAEKLAKMPDERHLPELAKRLLCDAYMCMYQSPDIMMYR